MKITRRILSSLLVLVMLLSGISCGFAEEQPDALIIEPVEAVQVETEESAALSDEAALSGPAEEETTEELQISVPEAGAETAATYCEPAEDISIEEIPAEEPAAEDTVPEETEESSSDLPAQDAETAAEATVPETDPSAEAEYAAGEAIPEEAPSEAISPERVSSEEVPSGGLPSEPTPSETPASEENSCAHESTRAFESFWPESFDQITDTEHRAYGSLREVITCTVCGDFISETILEEGIYRVQAHEFYDGVCDCGYVNSCLHGRTEDIESFIAESYDEITEAGHRKFGKSVLSPLCLDCGEWLEDTVLEENLYVSEPHSYYEGICECGRINSCAHEESALGEEMLYVDSYVEITEKYHKISGYTACFRQCLNCGESLEEIITNESVLQAEPHYFFNGVCECGHVNNCTHSFTNTYERTWNESYDQITDATHRMHADIYKAVVCADCDETLEEILIEAGAYVVEDHFFWDGVCDCGYVNTCAHENSRENEALEVWYYENITAATHDACGNLVRSKYCMDCYEDLEWEVLERDVHRTEPHEYGAESGVCYCGHVYVAFSLNTNEVKLGVGEKFTLEAANWSAELLSFRSENAKVAAVSKAGVITAKKAGTTKIIVSCGEISAECIVTVVKAPTKVTLSAAKLSMGAGQTLQLTAALNNGNKSKVAFTSSNKKVATVDEEGNITAVGKGTAKITATSYNKKKAACTVTVLPAPQEIILSAGELTLPAGMGAQIKAKVNKGAAAQYSFASSDESIAAVDASGNVSTLSPGSAVITATTYNGLTAACSVTVTPAPQSISLNVYEASLGVKEKLQITAANDQNCEAGYTYKSSSTKVATVSKTGTVTAKKAGKATITVSSYNGLTASCEITVGSAPTKITLSAKKLSLNAGESALLEYKLNKGAAGSVSFTSSKPEIASIDETGLITALAAGKTTITVKTYNGKKATCAVTVTASPTQIMLKEQSISLFCGDTAQIQAKVDQGTANFSYASSNEAVATVDAGGRISAISAGEAEITVSTGNGLTAACAVTVKPVPTQIILGSANIQLGVGESFRLVPEVDQGEAQYSYESSAPLVAAVDASGLITAMKAGEAEITVRTERGLTASCRVMVTALSIEEQIARMDATEEVKQELLIVADLGILTDNAAKESITGREMTVMLDRFIQYAAPEKMESWHKKYTNFREYDEELYRYDVMMALYLATQEAGGEYNITIDTDFERRFANETAHEWGDQEWLHGLFGEAEDQIYDMGEYYGKSLVSWAASMYNMAVPSDFSGEFPINYDAVNNSFHYDENASYADAALSLSRVISAANPGEFGKLPANKANSGVITQERIEKSNSNPETTAENHPIWSGFALHRVEGMPYLATGENLAHIADWGFNSVRVYLDCWDYFNRDDLTDPGNYDFLTLDGLVAAAIENNLHLNLSFISLPGREAYWNPETFESVGDFDLYINPEKQEKALYIWETFANRYKDVSSANLSFTPIVETTNWNMSTGLPYPDMTVLDAADYMKKAINAIREVDEDRLIIYEPSANDPRWSNEVEQGPIKKALEGIDNLIISNNFVQTPFVYYNMIATEGEHIDDNKHTLPLPEYPTYAYGASYQITNSEPLDFTGCLPAGTVIDVHLDKTISDGSFTVTADGEELYREYLPEESYNVGYNLSRFCMYAASDKHIRITLTEDTDKLTLAHSGVLQWSGIDVILPEEYAQEKWFSVTEYDVFLGVEEEAGLVKRNTSRIIVSPTQFEDASTEVVIHDDLTFTTDTLLALASDETVAEYMQAIMDLDSNTLVRFETANFTAGFWPEIADYYADFLSFCKKNNISWWSNDFELMTNYHGKSDGTLVGANLIPYDGFESFNLELLELLQKYQSKDSVTGEREPKIILNENNISLGYGESFRLTASMNVGEAQFRFESMNPELLSVDQNGLITTLADLGETEIIVTASNGQQASCFVRVYPEPHDMWIDSPQPCVLAVGQTYQLEAGAEWDAPIRYESTDEDVITVDEKGLITAVGTGKAQVILSLYNGLTASFNVTTAMPPEVLTEETDAQLHADLQQKIGAILNTETEITHSDTFIPGETYTGRAFYVSSDGDDNNDGLTPETAWRTIEKVNYEARGTGDGVIQEGDAVFFHRGDTFRVKKESFYMYPLNIKQKGVTVSAYGEGSKPIITASTENGSGVDKWILVHEDESGAKIWQYYRDMNDVSMVVCDNGEVITDRVYEFWDGDEYISCTDDYWNGCDELNRGVTLKDRLYTPEESLTEDLTIISRPERKMLEGGIGSYELTEKGPLYFRCDAGNPGELFESIEFSEYVPSANVSLDTNGIVIDNISFRCNGNSWLKASYQNGKNVTVQNCEFSYAGGCVAYYETTENGYLVCAQGDGIYNYVDNTTIRNNYFHDSVASAATYEAADDDPAVHGFYHFLDNVVVNTNGIRLDSTSEALKELSSVIIRGNQIWNTGSVDRGKYAFAEGSLLWMPNRYGEAIIEDNVFYTTEGGYTSDSLLNMVFYDHEMFSGFTKPVIQNNTYVQYEGSKFADFMMQLGESWKIDDIDVVARAAEFLGDLFSRFFIKK